MPDTQHTALITNDAVVLGLLATTLGAVFWTSSREQGIWKKFYSHVPAILLCYLLPAVYNSFGIIDYKLSAIDDMASRYLLPASLALFCLSMDLKAILRLGPKAGLMFLVGTFGVMLGALVAFEAMRVMHPQTVAGETWRGMTTIAGSWIGGSANQAAMKQAFDVPPNLFGQFAAIDVIVGYVWMAILLFLAARSERFDQWTRADTSGVERLKQSILSYQAEHSRIASMSDLMAILAVAFGATGLAYLLAEPVIAWLHTLPAAWNLESFSLYSTTLWVVVLATTFGILLSFTRARTLEGAGASRFGSVMLYVLIASIGMQIDLTALADRRGLFLLALGFIWISVHAVLMLVVARLIRAPLFFMAVGSQANIGGAASASVVATAFHPALAPVGVLLAVAGYGLGTYAALVVGNLLRLLAGA